MRDPKFWFFFAFIFWKMRHHEIFGSLKGLPLNSFEIYGMGSRCPKKRWKTQFLKVLFYVFSCKTLVWKRDISIIFNWNQHNLKFEHCRFHAKWCKMHIFKRYTCKINLQFRAFCSIFWGALSSGALRDSVTLPQKMMKNGIFEGFIWCVLVEKYVKISIHL